MMNCSQVAKPYVSVEPNSHIIKTKKQITTKDCQPKTSKNEAWKNNNFLNIDKRNQNKIKGKDYVYKTKT